MISFVALDERIAITPRAEEAKMPISERKPQAELNSMEKLDKSEPEDPWDPYNCPTCRSGVIEYPPAIMADVVSVEL